MRTNSHGPGINYGYGIRVRDFGFYPVVTNFRVLVPFVPVIKFQIIAISTQYSTHLFFTARYDNLVDC